MTTTYPIVGSFYRPPAKAILASLPVGTPLLLRPEPDNHVDANAIAIYVNVGDFPEGDEAFKKTLLLRAAEAGWEADDIWSEYEWHLGYIPAVMAKRVTLAGDTPAVLEVGFDGKYCARVVSDDTL